MAKNKQLPPTWFIEKLDLEYQQYVLLDYLQFVDNEFEKMKIFPHIMDLKYHYSNLESFLKSREIIIGSMTKIKAVDLRKMEMVYDFPEDGKEMKEIMKIIEWSIPKIEESFKKGRFLYAHVEESIELNYIGIIPEKYTKEGFFFIRQGNKTIVDIYEYKVKNIIDPGSENVKMVSKKIDSFDFISKDNYDNAKRKISEKTNQLNPLFICVESSDIFPIEETMLPVTERMILDKIKKDYSKKIKK